MELYCTLCSYRCGERLDLIKHQFGAHSFEPTFRLFCWIKGCQHCFRTGSSFSSFKTHANRKHKNWQDSINDTESLTSVSPAVLLASSTEQSTSILPVDVDVSDHNDTSSAVPDTPAPDDRQLDTVTNSLTSHLPLDGSFAARRAAALFLLTFKEKHELAQKSIDFAVGSIHTIIDGVLKSAAFSVHNLLESDSSPSYDDIASCMEGCEDPFATLGTKFLQDKFYRNEFGLVVSTCTCMYRICTCTVS